MSPNGEFENVRQFRKGDRVVIQDLVSKWWNLQAIVIYEPKLRNYTIETEGQYHHNQKFLNLLPNPNPVIDIKPPMVILRNMIKPEVKSWIDIQYVWERALLKRFNNECTTAEVQH